MNISDGNSNLGGSSKDSSVISTMVADPNKSLLQQSIFGPEHGAEFLKPTIPETNSVRIDPLVPRDEFPNIEKPVIAVDETVAPIQIVNGKGNRKPYSSLEAACTEASDLDGNSIIELCYNGSRDPERPIRLSNKRVIIRAGEGYRPTIRFVVSDSIAEEIQPHMITVVGGSLELVKVDIVMNIPNRIGLDRWAIFSLENPEKVQLKRVTLTIVNPNNKPACVFEQNAPVVQSLSNVGIRNDGMTFDPPELRLTESLVRGNGDLIAMRQPVSARYELKDTAVGIDGNLLRMKLVMESMESSGKDREKIGIELEHLTFRFGQSLVFIEGTGDSTEKLPQIIVDARNNLISSGSNQPLISIQSLADFMDFQRSFTWRGKLNFYDKLQTFLEISTPQLTGNRSLDYAQWVSNTSEGAGSNNASVLWSVKSPSEPSSKRTRWDFKLSTDSQPAVKGASEGYAAGADLGNLPDAGRVDDSVKRPIR